MSTNSTTVSNNTEGYLNDVVIDVEEFLYGSTPTMEQQLELADLLISMGDKLYHDAELYGEVTLLPKYKVTTVGRLKTLVNEES